MRLSEELNSRAKGDQETLVSPPQWPVEVWVIPTNEELVIARETARIVAESAHG